MPGAIKNTKIGSTAGRIEVTGAFSKQPTQPNSLDAEEVSTAVGAYISSQKASKLFEVVFTSADGTTQLTEMLKLTADTPNSLTPGQFCVQIILDDSTVVYVSKLYNNTIHWVNPTIPYGEPLSTGWLSYTLRSEGISL